MKTAVLIQFKKIMGETISCQGTLWNKTETMKTSKKLPGMSQRIRKGPIKQKGKFSKETAVLMHFFQGNRKNLIFSELCTYQGTLWNQSENMRTSKEPSGMS